MVARWPSGLTMTARHLPGALVPPVPRCLSPCAHPSGAHPLGALVPPCHGPPSPRHEKTREREKMKEKEC